VFSRSWKTLGDFIRVQAIVSFVDAFFIGLGLVVLGVPLAAALAVLTFFAGFIPIVGALAAGTLAVLVALVSNGLTTALIVLGIIIVVQQLESNVLQPVLQGRSLNLHAAVVLLAVTAGGTLFGIIGAFLAVPVAAVTAAVLRYISEQISLRTGEVHANDLPTTTPEGSAAARRGERAARRFQQPSAARDRELHD
jgi:predicted PurR-regulated permease PerM